MYKKPVDKYDGVKCKKIPRPLGSLGRVEGQLHKFGNNLVNFQYYYRNFVCRKIKKTNRYEIYQTGYLIGCLGPIPWVDLGDGASPK